jgi:hypothetical protein
VKALVTAAGACLAVASSSGTAHAQVFFPDVGPALEGVSGALFLPPLIVNAVYVAKGTRAPIAWPVLGYVAGALGMTVGLGFALPNGSSVDDNAGLKIGLGAALAIEGALNIGMATWALLLPKAGNAGTNDPPGTPRWTLAPFVARDVSGRPKVGAALSIVQF